MNVKHGRCKRREGCRSWRVWGDRAGPLCQRCDRYERRLASAVKGQPRRGAEASR